MNFAYSTRVKAGILLIVFFALLSSYRLLALNVQFNLSFIGRDEVTENDKRFERIRDVLPRRGIVEYWPNGEKTTYEELLFGNATDLQHWFMTQYALAPLIVSPTPGHNLIIGNFRSYVGFELLGQKPTMKGLEDADEVVDLGNGVLLLNRELK